MTPSSAVRIHKNGGPEELRFETDRGGCSPDRTRCGCVTPAVGLNFTDIHHRTGRYPGPGFPLILGMEAAGVVEQSRRERHGRSGGRSGGVWRRVTEPPTRRLLPAAHHERGETGEAAGLAGR